MARGKEKIDFLVESIYRPLTILSAATKGFANWFQRYGSTIKFVADFSESTAASREHGNLGFGILTLGFVALILATMDLVFKYKTWALLTDPLESKPEQSSDDRKKEQKKAFASLIRSFLIFCFTFLLTASFEILKFFVGTGIISWVPAIHLVVILSSPWIGIVATGIFTAILLGIVIYNWKNTANRINAKNGHRLIPAVITALSDNYCIISLDILSILCTSGSMLISILVISLVISNPVGIIIASTLSAGAAATYIVRYIIKSSKTPSANNASRRPVNNRGEDQPPPQPPDKSNHENDDQSILANTCSSSVSESVLNTAACTNTGAKVEKRSFGSRITESFQNYWQLATKYRAEINLDNVIVQDFREGMRGSTHIILPSLLETTEKNTNLLNLSNLLIDIPERGHINIDIGTLEMIHLGESFADIARCEFTKKTRFFADTMKVGKFFPVKQVSSYLIGHLPDNEVEIMLGKLKKIQSVSIAKIKQNPDALELIGKLFLAHELIIKLNLKNLAFSQALRSMGESITLIPFLKLNENNQHLFKCSHMDGGLLKIKPFNNNLVIFSLEEQCCCQDINDTNFTPLIFTLSATYYYNIENGLCIMNNPIKISSNNRKAVEFITELFPLTPFATGYEPVIPHVSQSYCTTMIPPSTKEKNAIPSSTTAKPQFSPILPPQCVVS